MEKKNDKFTLTKIPLEPLIEILLKIYELGMEYVDIEGTIDGDNVKDTIDIKFNNTYADIDESDEDIIKGYIHGYNDVDDDERKPFSDDDINELI
jgi:hypothetical protein|tara:strand:- start:272 stop:556 length:285 start_codon:yes stop_codon:yes gene_type:complete